MSPNLVTLDMGDRIELRTSHRQMVSENIELKQSKISASERIKFVTR